MFTAAFKIVLLAASLVTLSACSAVRVAYKQLDWMVEKQVAQYVDLDTHQQQRLEADIDALLDWHCRTEVQAYARWLRQVNDDFQQTVSMHQLRGHSRALEDAWRRIMSRSIPAMADLAGSLSDAQVEELLTGLERDNEDYRAEYLDPAEKTLRGNSERWMRKSLKRWLGPLSDGQERAVRRWSQRLLLMGEIGWQNRLRWQNELAGLLARRHDREVLVAGLERLLLHWRSHQDAEYRRRFEANSELTAELLVEVSDSMSSAQRTRMEKKALGYASDLDSLHCRGKQRPGAAELEHRGRPLAANRALLPG